MPLLYGFCVFFIRIWVKLAGCRIIGRENISGEGPLLIIANHSSFGDPVLLAAAFPQHITFIAKEGFYRQPFTKWLFGLAGVVFLNKEESDLTALRNSINRLKEGRTVGIFPEGRRNRDQVIGDFMPGASYIAAKAGVPVQPVAISNSKDLPRFWKRNVVINIGPPAMISLTGRLSQQQLAEQAALFQENIRELYAENIKLLRE